MTKISKISKSSKTSKSSNKNKQKKLPCRRTKHSKLQTTPKKTRTKQKTHKRKGGEPEEYNIIIIRHGERYDQIQDERKYPATKNWYDNPFQTNKKKYETKLHEDDLPQIDSSITTPSGAGHVILCAELLLTYLTINNLPTDLEMYVSPFLRTRQTAHLLHKFLLEQHVPKYTVLYDLLYHFYANYHENYDQIRQINQRLLPPNTEIPGIPDDTGPNYLKKLLIELCKRSNPSNRTIVLIAHSETITDAIAKNPEPPIRLDNLPDYCQIAHFKLTMHPHPDANPSREHEEEEEEEEEESEDPSILTTIASFVVNKDNHRTVVVDYQKKNSNTIVPTQVRSRPSQEDIEDMTGMLTLENASSASIIQNIEFHPLPPPTLYARRRSYSESSTGSED